MPKKNKGYYGHSTEHSLNARGVLTSKSHFVVNHHNYDVDVTSVKPGLVDVCVYRNGEEIMKTRMEPVNCCNITYINGPNDSIYLGIHVPVCPPVGVNVP